MKGFLFDENLPSRLQFTPSLPLIHVAQLGRSPTDSEVWSYSETHDLVIVTKDADFSLRALLQAPPPRVVHIRVGNMRKGDLHVFLATIWPKVEALVQTHKLVNVYHHHIDAVV